MLVVGGWWGSKAVVEKNGREGGGAKISRCYEILSPNWTFNLVTTSSNEREDISQVACPVTSCQRIGHVVPCAVREIELHMHVRRDEWDWADPPGYIIECTGESQTGRKMYIYDWHCNLNLLSVHLEDYPYIKSWSIQCCKARCRPLAPLHNLFYPRHTYIHCAA